MRVVLNKNCNGYDLSNKAFLLWLKESGTIYFLYEGSYMASGGIHYLKRTIGIDTLLNYPKELDDLVVTLKDYGKSFDLVNGLVKSYDVSLNVIEFPNFEAFNPSAIKRDDKILVDIILRLGLDSFGVGSELVVVEFPDVIDYYISNNDGCEDVCIDAKELKFEQ